MSSSHRTTWSRMRWHVTIYFLRILFRHRPLYPDVRPSFLPNAFLSVSGGWEDGLYLEHWFTAPLWRVWAERRRCSMVRMGHFILRKPSTGQGWVMEFNDICPSYWADFCTFTDICLLFYEWRVQRSLTCKIVVFPNAWKGAIFYHC